MKCRLGFETGEGIPCYSHVTIQIVSQTAKRQKLTSRTKSKDRHLKNKPNHHGYPATENPANNSIPHFN